MNAPSHKPPSCLEMLCQCKPRLSKLEAVAEAARRISASTFGLVGHAELARALKILDEDETK